MIKRLCFFVLLSFFAIFITSCQSPKTPPVKRVDTKTLDTLIAKYKKSDIFDNKPKLQKSFRYRYFSPWRKNGGIISKKAASWGFLYLKRINKFFGENKLPYTKKEAKYLKDISNFKDFNSVKKSAIVIDNCDLRVFPTQKPLFRDFDKAGEGYPFDYNQNSTLWINTPVYISHYSKDKEWAYVYSSFASGWVMVKNIALVDKKMINRYKNSPFVVAMNDNIPLYDRKKSFLSRVKLSTLFILKKVYKKRYKILVVRKDSNNRAYFYSTFVKKSDFERFIPDISKQNIKKVISNLLGEKYGWGGYLNNRDCSTLTRDYFKVFGIWIPRNSKAQAAYLHCKKLTNLTREQKERMIAGFGRPFETLLYLKGHIMLYLGEIGDRVYVLHNMWGIRTKTDGKEGRFIVGKAILSDLFIGEELQNVDTKKLLIDRVKSFCIVDDGVIDYRKPTSQR